MKSQPNYVSVFKINGIPIHPPIITQEKRSILQQYYDQAIAVEQRLKDCRKAKLDPAPENDKNLLIDALNNNVPTPNSSPTLTTVDQSEAHEIKSNNSNISLTTFSESSIHEDTLNVSCDIVHSDVNLSQSESGFDTFRCPLRSSFSEIEVKSSKTSSPCSQRTTPRHVISDKTTHYCSVQNLSSEPETPTPSPRIVRSNSFTLAEPSPMLLRHLEATGIQYTARQHLPQSCISTPTQKSKYSKSLNHKTINYKMTLVKAKVQSNPPKLRNKPNGQDDRLKSANSSLSGRSSFKSETGDFRENSCKKLSNKMQTNQIEDLLRKQRCEYERMNKKFLEEQRHLLQDLNVPELIVTQHRCDEVLRNNTTSIDDIDGNIVYANKLCLDDGSESQRSSTLAETSPETFYTASRSKSYKFYSDVDSPRNKSCSRQLFTEENSTKPVPVPPDNMNEEHAATVINAYVRGYLVRRLFKTEELQTKVRTIQDTLVFILELYDDTGDTCDDGLLKARLVQQLEAALHDIESIFFDMNPTDRMQIISRDRERLKVQLHKQTQIRKLLELEKITSGHRKSHDK